MDDELERIRARLRDELLANARAASPPALADGDLAPFVRQHRMVLVDVWAPWCGPCRQMSPLVEELGRSWRGRVAVAKLNADEAPDAVRRFRITGIPTFLWFQDGAFVGRQVGAQPRAAFEQVLAELEEARPEPTAGEATG